MELKTIKHGTDLDRMIEIMAVDFDAGESVMAPAKSSLLVKLNSDGKAAGISHITDGEEWDPDAWPGVVTIAWENEPSLDDVFQSAMQLRLDIHETHIFHDDPVRYELTFHDARCLVDFVYLTVFMGGEMDKFTIHDPNAEQSRRLIDLIDLLDQMVPEMATTRH